MRAIIQRVQPWLLAIIRRLQPYSLAFLTPLVVFFITQGVATWNAPVTFSLYVLAVIIGAYVGGTRAGVYGTALAVGFLIWHYGFPSQKKQVLELTDLYPVLVPFTLVSVFASYLASMSRQSVNLFSNLHGTVMGMAEGVILADERGQIAFMNAAAQKLTGWTQDNAFKKSAETIFRVLDAKTREPLKRPATGSLEPEHDVVAWLVARDGAEKLIEYTAEPLKNAKGASAGSMLLLHEAGAQHIEEEELRQREAQYRAVASAAPVGIIVLDQNGECTYCNAACQTLAGFTAKEATGSGWTKFLDPADQAAVDEWKNAARQGVLFTKELRFKDGLGLSRWVRLRADAARSDHGQYLGHVAVLEDLGQLKDLERQLAERKDAEDKLRQSAQEREAQTNKRLAALDAARVRLEEQLAERQQAEESLRQEHGQRQSQWQQTESKLRQESSTGVDGLRRELDRAVAERKQLEEALRSAQSTAENHRGALDRAIAERKQLEEAHRSVQSTAEGHRRDLERAVAERKQLEEALRLAQSTTETVADPRTAVLEASHKKLQQQLAEHKKTLEELRREHLERQSGWEEREAQLRQDLTGHQTTAQRLQKQLADAQERERKLRQEFGDLQTAHDQASEQLRRQEDDWKRRMNELNRQHVAKHGELEEERQLWQSELTTQGQAAKRAAFLADASRAFAAAFDDDEIVAKIGSSAIPFLADACVVFGPGEKRDFGPVALSANDGDKAVRTWDQASLESLSASAWPEVAQFLSRGKPAVQSELPAGLRRELGQLPLPADQTGSLNSSVVVPLVVGGSAKYLVVLLRNRATAPFSADELPLAQDYGHRAMLALNHVRRHQDLSERHQAIQAAHQSLEEQHQAVRTAHQQLEEQHRHLRRVLSSLPHSIVAIDAEGNLAHLNAAAEALLGWPEAEAREWKIDALLPEENNALAFLKSETELARTLGNHPVLRNDRVVLRRYDGRNMEVACTVARIGEAAQIEGAVLTFHEMSATPSKTATAEPAAKPTPEAPATIEMEKLLHRLTDRCGPILAKMWSAVGVLGRNAAHDDETRQQAAVLDRQMQQLGRGLAKLELAARIADHSLTITKERVDICAAIDRAVEHMQPLLREHGHHLTVALPLFPEWVSADEACLEQTITVLLENAALYTKSGGTITMIVEHRADELWLRVKDNGKGLTPQAIPELLGLSAEGKRYWDGGGDGLGIGLALARTLAEMHGGSISVTSPGSEQGSEFVLRWPALVERMGAEPPRHVVKASYASSSPALLSA